MDYQCPKATMRDGQIYCRNTMCLCSKQYFDTMGARYKLGVDSAYCENRNTAAIPAKPKKKAGRPKKNG